MFIFCLDTKNEPKKIKAIADSLVAYLLDIRFTHRDESDFFVPLKNPLAICSRKYRTTFCSSLRQMRSPPFYCI